MKAQNKIAFEALVGFGVLIGTLLLLQVVLTNIMHFTIRGSMLVSLPTALVSILSGVIGNVWGFRLHYLKDSKNRASTVGGETNSSFAVVFIGLMPLIGLSVMGWLLVYGSLYALVLARASVAVGVSDGLGIGLLVLVRRAAGSVIRYFNVPEQAE